MNKPALARQLLIRSLIVAVIAIAAGHFVRVHLHHQHEIPDQLSTVFTLLSLPWSLAGLVFLTQPFDAVPWGITANVAILGIIYLNVYWWQKRH